MKNNQLKSLRWNPSSQSPAPFTACQYNITKPASNIKQSPNSIHKFAFVCDRAKMRVCVWERKRECVSMCVLWSLFILLHSFMIRSFDPPSQLWGHRKSVAVGWNENEEFSETLRGDLIVRSSLAIPTRTPKHTNTRTNTRTHKHTH